MSINKLEQIDPALALLNAFSKISLGTSQKIQQMRQEVILALRVFAWNHKIW